jgi:hypothetical protein
MRVENLKLKRFIYRNRELFSTASPSTIVKTRRVSDFYFAKCNGDSYGFAAKNAPSQVAQRERP